MLVTRRSETLPLDDALVRIIEARHPDPFEVLGRHLEGKRAIVRAFLPKAETVHIEEAGLTLERIPNTDLFVGNAPAAAMPRHYRLHWIDKAGCAYRSYDPYAFPPLLGDLDLHLFNEGRHWHAYRMLGAHGLAVNGIAGVRFAVWAPNAARVSVVGDFNDWDGRVHPMRARGGSGVWELFVPQLAPGCLYKYELRTQDGQILVKIDPYAFRFQLRPDTACMVTGPSSHGWGDATWMARRAAHNWPHRPMSIYEVHLGSWQRAPDGGFLNYRELAERLTAYVTELGFTHIELLPITEHPLDASWGYQTTGYFAPSSRFGSPDDFRFFVDTLHQADIGVILDWVPAHFPRDAFALAQFDGSALYEHTDPRLGERRDWGALTFNYGRNEVRNFLLASALFWLEEYHIDALRVDALASMLYLDNSKQDGDWILNQYGGRENLEAVAFLRELNTVTHERHPGSLMIAEESTAWPAVSRPTYLGGLGFSMKWDLGWMRDSLAYLAQDPVRSPYHHDLLSFGLPYLFTENFVLPLSHNEVAHGKYSMLDQMSGDDWRRFASLRLLYTWLYTYPGKKLLFMGCEFAQGREWSFAEELDWPLLEREQHRGVYRLVRDLNRLYRALPPLHDLGFDPSGFDWLDGHEDFNPVLSFLRKDRLGRLVVVILNFTPLPRESYRIGVPLVGLYHEVLNSDAARYWGSNMGNGGEVASEPRPWMNRDHSLVLNLPPLGGLILVHGQGEFGTE